MSIKINTKGLFSKIVILLIVALNIWFVCQMIELLPQLTFEPVALIGGWFAFTTGELWALAIIKKKKIKVYSQEEETSSEDK